MNLIVKLVNPCHHPSHRQISLSDFYIAQVVMSDLWCSHTSKPADSEILNRTARHHSSVRVPHQLNDLQMPISERFSKFSILRFLELLKFRSERHCKTAISFSFLSIPWKVTFQNIVTRFDFVFELRNSKYMQQAWKCSTFFVSH